MCCRSRGVGSGSSAIPDDYRRFHPAVNAICVKTVKYRLRLSLSASASGGNSRDPNAGRLGPDGPLVDCLVDPVEPSLAWYPARGGVPGRGELIRFRRAGLRSTPQKRVTGNPRPLAPLETGPMASLEVLASTSVFVADRHKCPIANRPRVLMDSGAASSSRGVTRRSRPCRRRG
jgi:hypothetical protein